MRKKRLNWVIKGNFAEGCSHQNFRQKQKKKTKSGAVRRAYESTYVPARHLLERKNSVADGIRRRKGKAGSRVHHNQKFCEEVSRKSDGGKRTNIKLMKILVKGALCGGTKIGKKKGGVISRPQAP